MGDHKIKRGSESEREHESARVRESARKQQNNVKGEQNAECGRGTRKEGEAEVEGRQAGERK